MKKTHLLILLITALFSCDSFDKLKKTEEIVKEIDAKKKDDFFIEASIQDNKSRLSITLDHEYYLAYYTGALYEIIMELHKKNVEYDEYEIKNRNGDIAWRVKDSEIEEITKTIVQSKKVIQLLNRKEYYKFLSLSNFSALGISDSVFFKSMHQNSIYPNTNYKGFSMTERQINGEQRKILYVYFMNDELKENVIIISPDDKLVYGLEF